MIADKKSCTFTFATFVVADFRWQAEREFGDLIFCLHADKSSEIKSVHWQETPRLFANTQLPDWTSETWAEDNLILDSAEGASWNCPDGLGGALWVDASLSVGWGGGESFKHFEGEVIETKLWKNLSSCKIFLIFRLKYFKNQLLVLPKSISIPIPKKLKRSKLPNWKKKRW